MLSAPSHGTLPEHGDAPSFGQQCVNVLSVANCIPFELGSPERPVRGRHRGVSTASVPMPEAAMHEHHRVVLWQNYVRAPGKIGSVQPEAESVPVKVAPHGLLGLRVTTTDGRHYPAAHVLRNDVGRHVSTCPCLCSWIASQRPSPAPPAAHPSRESPSQAACHQRRAD